MKKKRVVKRNKRSTKHGCLSGKGIAKLTPTEKEILCLLTKDFLTPKQIQIRRQCSKQAVNKHIRNLIKKGAYNIGCRLVDDSIPTTKRSYVNAIRLHAQEFNIKILFKDQRYHKTLEKCNTIEIDGNTVRLSKESIEVYSGQSFFSDDVQKATVKSFKYWQRFFARLEHDLKVIIVKPRSQNIKLVNQHYAEINNELAKESERKGYKIRVYTTDDGKLWFSIDNSFNLQEAETQHPGTAERDMGEVVKPFFNDMRDKPNYLPSEIRETVTSTLKLVHEIAAAQLNQTKIIGSLLPNNLTNKIEDKQIKLERPNYVG